MVSANRLMCKFCRGGDRRLWDLFSISSVNSGKLAYWKTKTKVPIHCSCKSSNTDMFRFISHISMLQYGCNPTGMTATLERRKEVLELAREHNFLILEGRILRIS